MPLTNYTAQPVTPILLYTFSALVAFILASTHRRYVVIIIIILLPPFSIFLYLFFFSFFSFSNFNTFEEESRYIYIYIYIFFFDQQVSVLNDNTSIRLSVPSSNEDRSLSIRSSIDRTEQISNNNYYIPAIFFLTKHFGSYG